MEELTYEKASRELELILGQLKEDQVGIDELATKVERASELITFCKKKLMDTEKKVDQIIDKLEM
ncbi:exodeoxyribonuclease VII small subunit [Myroides sp. LJL115]